MKLKNQLLALSLLTLLLPWSGLKLVQELENFLRAGEETALEASAHTIAQALPMEYQSSLKLARGQILPLRQFSSPPILDGYATDWPELRQNLAFESTRGTLKLQVLGGRSGSRFYLLLKVTDSGGFSATEFNANTTAPAQKAGVMLYLQSKRQQQAFMIATEAPGPLSVRSQAAAGSRLEAAWMDNIDGYSVEVSLPADVERISVGAVAPASILPGVNAWRYAGTLIGAQQGKWLELTSRDGSVGHWLATVVPAHSRVWLVQSDGWVMADSGPVGDVASSELTWVQRMIYQGIADSTMQARETRPEWPVRFESVASSSTLAAGESTQWSRDADSAAVYNLVAVPVRAAGVVIGTVLLETRSEGLLLMTNRALGQLLFITLLMVGVLVGGLWLFATYLSRRVRKLSGALSRAMDDSSKAPRLPTTTSGDELGELARNTEKLLRAVAEHTRYLQKLASRLSHELKTPIAITRSSLENLGENLSAQQLDEQSRQYLTRAREGLDRQAAIVSAMSAAQRLEEAVKTADWENVDLTKMLDNFVAASRSVHPVREINLHLVVDDCELYCAPDLLAQALDKLVDNAVTLSPADSRLDISLRCDHGECLIKVANSGTRLPDVLPERLFDSLVSLRENRSKGQHLGLGLHIVRLVAGIHGGTVSASNLPDDTGVEFIIRLPLARSG